MGIGLVGKPETGKSWQLAYVRGDADGGVNDAGVQPVALGEGIGTLSYSEGCINKGSYNQWRSTGGTLTITSVEDPAEQPQGATPGANKTVKFTFSNVTMASDGEPATGTFTANGDGEVLLFTGKNQ